MRKHNSANLFAKDCSLQNAASKNVMGRLICVFFFNFWHFTSACCAYPSISCPHMSHPFSRPRILSTTNCPIHQHQTSSLIYRNDHLFVFGLPILWLFIINEYWRLRQERNIRLLWKKQTPSQLPGLLLRTSHRIILASFSYFI